MKTLPFAAALFPLAVLAPQHSSAQDKATDTDPPSKETDRIRMMEFVAIRPGMFNMGAPKRREDLQADEPNHPVEVRHGFEIKKTEVTWQEWNLVRDRMSKQGYSGIAEGSCGHRSKGDNKHPVTGISWWDAVVWCNLKSQVEDRRPVYHTSKPFNDKSILTSAPGDPLKLFVNPAANGYRLPTEAEWELAWRKAGKPPAKEKKPDAPAGTEELCGWNLTNSDHQTKPVGSRLGKRSEVVDMLGNVAEWCWGWQATLSSNKPGTNPKETKPVRYPIYRGGSWADDRWCCRYSYRGAFSPVMPRSPFVGFRPVRGPRR